MGLFGSLPTEYTFFCTRSYIHISRETGKSVAISGIFSGSITKMYSFAFYLIFSIYKMVLLTFLSLQKELSSRIGQWIKFLLSLRREEDWIINYLPMDSFYIFTYVLIDRKMNGTLVSVVWFMKLLDMYFMSRQISMIHLRGHYRSSY